MERMYVLIRDNLPTTTYKAVQGGHAVAQYMLEHPNNTWSNHTLIYVTVPTEDNLDEWCYKLKEKGILYSKFIEPDIGNSLTAVSCIVVDNKIFKKLKLLKD